MGVYIIELVAAAFRFSGSLPEARELLSLLISISLGTPISGIPLFPSLVHHNALSIVTQYRIAGGARWETQSRAESLWQSLFVHSAIFVTLPLSISVVSSMNHVSIYFLPSFPYTDSNSYSTMFSLVCFAHKSHKCDAMIRAAYFIWANPFCCSVLAIILTLESLPPPDPHLSGLF